MRCLLTLLAVLVSGTAGAQPFTEDAQTTEPGRALVEVGATLEGYRVGGVAGATVEEASVSFPEALVRIGLTSGLEARVTSPDYARRQFVGTGTFADGLSDPTAGLKVEVGRLAETALALVVQTSIPVGDKLLGDDEPTGGRFVPGAILSAGRALDDTFALEAQVQSAYFGSGNAPSGGHTVVNAMAVLHATLGGPLSGYAEMVVEDELGGFSGAPYALVHTGAAVAVSPHAQVDLEVGFGLSGAAPDYLIGVGTTVAL